MKMENDWTGEAEKPQMEPEEKSQSAETGNKLFTVESTRNIDNN